MRIVSPLRTLMLSCVLLALLAAPGEAKRVALLPLADVSLDANGIDLPLTDELTGTLAAAGVELIPQAEVRRFMAQNRIRFSGHLDSFMVKRMGRQLSCSLVLVGTVTEKGGKGDQALGMTLMAVDVESGTPIWSTTRAMSLAGQVRALGIGEPQNLEDLTEPLLIEIVADLTRKLSELAFPLGRYYQLSGLELSPAYVRGGTALDCTLEIRFLDAAPARIAVRSAAGKSYLYPDERSDVYRGTLIAPQAQGQYPVSLDLEWGRRRSVETIENITAFEVINEPPQLRLELKKGVQVGQIIAFRDHLLILPRLAEPKPMQRWAIEIKSEDGRALVHEEHEGNLPERMVWDGRDGKRHTLANGTYEFVLHAWDPAGNHSRDSRMIAFQPTARPVAVSPEALNGRISLKLEPQGETGLPLTSWSFEAALAEGEVLVQRTGVDLPATIELPPLQGQTEIRYNLEGVDLVGNRVSLRNQALQLEALIEEQDQDQGPEAWIDDF